MTDIRRWDVTFSMVGDTRTETRQCLTERSYSTSAQFGKMIALTSNGYMMTDTLIDVRAAIPREVFQARIFGEWCTVLGVEWDRDGFVWVKVVGAVGNSWRRLTRDEWSEAEWSATE